jgi:hypothetical protein
MRQSTITIAMLCWIAAAPVATASEIMPWQNLIGSSAQDYDDPYRDLSLQQLSDLGQLVRLRHRMKQDDVSANAQPELEQQLAELEKGLTEAGIDIDWLLGQRWTVAERRLRAASAGNPELNGKQITLAGYTIPGPIGDDGSQISYLVPKRGMCAHMPPPHPNQMIKIRSSRGEIPSEIYTPVKISGMLRIEPSAERLFLIDGPREMRATFALDLNGIKTFSKPRHPLAPVQMRKLAPRHR